MSGSIRTTYPTWHQPWACLGCEKHGEVIVKVQARTDEWLRGMARGVDQSHRAQSPMCPHDISTAYPTSHPKRPIAQEYGYRGPLVLARPYRQSKNTGQRIYAQGPNEDGVQALLRAKKEVWPPWHSRN